MRNHRVDLSNKLTHLIHADSDHEAIETLYRIACDGHLEGTTRGVIGKNQVVCFSEAPEGEFIKEKNHFKPFGISIDKAYFFSSGGRPVIYQPKEEHAFIAPELHWKLVTYNPTSSTEHRWIDWSWQREWRIRTDRFLLPVEQTTFLVPSEVDREILIDKLMENEWLNAEFEALAIGMIYPMPRDFPYKIEVISS